MTFNENLIREAAYYNWQNAGCPFGQDEKFWQSNRFTVPRLQSLAAALLLLPRRQLLPAKRLLLQSLNPRSRIC